MLIVIGVGVVVIGGVLFFALIRYTSPVNEAGREYSKHVRSYKNEEIKTMDDVFERVEVLDSHFDSTTFDKVQGGEKREVTVSDVETLFGKADQVIEDVDRSPLDSVHQYHYEDFILNFHERFSEVDEYVMENDTEEKYDSQALDQLFIDTMKNHQSQYNKVDGEFELISEENIFKLELNPTPTRKIRENGWSMRYLTQQYYFEKDSEEFLILHFKGSRDGVTGLQLMGRRYHEPDVKEDTNEQALSHFLDAFEERESSKSDESFIVEDFSREFGKITSMLYHFRDGILEVSWVVDDGGYSEEVVATVPITDRNNISDIDDLARLEVNDFNYQQRVTW